MLKIFIFAASLYPLILASATIVGPITFGTNASYDANFKESFSNQGNTRNPAGYLQLQGFQYGPAVFDTSATGSSNGSGGTGGNDANNDFSNFAISGTVATSEVGQFGLGFLLRLNNDEGNGYFASMMPTSANTVGFDLFEGAGLNEGLGVNIFSTSVPMSLFFATNTFYPFNVTANEGTFTFDFASGAATASFTDTTVSATTGQVGFVLTTASPSAATRFNNFAVVPEPGTMWLLIMLAAGFVAARRPRSPVVS